MIKLKEKIEKNSKNKEIAESPPCKETLTKEEIQTGFNANLDYFGRGYSAYLYFLLIIAITTTTWLLDIGGNGSNNAIIRLFQPYGLNGPYLTLILWVVFFIGLDLINIQYRDRYNKLLGLYYAKTGPIIIEKEAYAIKILKHPLKIAARQIVRVLNIIRYIIKSLQHYIKKLQ